MSHTDSTYARRWPINWGLRLRLALGVGVLLATMTAAHADWTPKDVPGTPTDVRVWGPGVFSVATSSGAYLFRPDGGVVSVSSPFSSPAVGTRLVSRTGCFAGFFRDDSTLVSPMGCPNGLVFADATVLVAGVKVSESGAAYGLGYDPSGVTQVAFTPTDTGPWWPPDNLGVLQPAMTMGVASHGGAEHALTAIEAMNGVTLSWLVDGGSKASYGLADSSPPHEVQSIDLFPGGDINNPTALFGWAGTLYRGTLVSGTRPPFQPVPLPTGPGEVVGVDVNTDAGSQYGDGFGMVVVQHDGGVSLLSAVPARAPQEVGVEWRVNPKLPPAVVAPRYVSCQGAQTCVIAQRQPPPGNLFVYINTSPPSISPDAGTSLNEGTVDFPFAIRASDPDGDAVRVTVDGGRPPVLTFTQSDVDGGVDLKLTAGDVCANTTVPLTVVASDGLAAHDQVQTLYFDVIHTRRASAPGVPPNFVVQSGTDSLTITATDPAMMPCQISGFTWSALSPNPLPLQSSGGRTAVFPTPQHLCQRDGVNYVYRVVANDDAGVASAPADFTVQVKPWGPPEAPFAVEKHVDLVAGASARLTPDTPVHQCDKPDAGFPGVDTVWEIVQGAPLPPTVRLRTQDNTLITATSAVTPELRVETDPCAAANLKLSVTNYTLDGSGLEAASTAWVNVDPQWTRLEDANLGVSADTLAATFISGTTSAPNLNCVAERGGVKVRITLSRDDGSDVHGDFPLGTPWQLQIPAVCGGQSFHLKAELLGPSGPQSPSLPVVVEDVSVPPVKVELEPLQAPQLLAACGSQARGTVEQRLPEGPCASLPLTWEQVSGPELVPFTPTEPRIELTTKEAEFGELIGQEVVMRVTVNSGVVSTIEHTIPITADPFISMNRSVESVVGADTDLIGVSVELHNLTDCDVHHVDHMEHLVGADYVPGSARFNDTPVEAEVDGESLILRDLPLERGSTGRLTYVVRPRLLGKTRIEGQSFVRGVPVSQSIQVPVSGCGCEGGGSGFAALGLAGLAAVLRRRRTR